MLYILIKIVIPGTVSLYPTFNLHSVLFPAFSIYPLFCHHAMNFRSAKIFMICSYNNHRARPTRHNDTDWYYCPFFSSSPGPTGTVPADPPIRRSRDPSIPSLHLRDVTASERRYNLYRCSSITSSDQWNELRYCIVLLVAEESTGKSIFEDGNGETSVGSVVLGIGRDFELLSSPTIVVERLQAPIIESNF